MTKLPNKPSELIRLAIADLTKVERSAAYRVDMGHYHEPVELTDPVQYVCAVCFAGAVMAKTLDASKRDRVTPDCFDRDTAHKLHALNEFRTGLVRSGLCMMGIRYIDSPVQVPVAVYKYDRNQFKQDMRLMASELEAIGL